MKHNALRQGYFGNRDKSELSRAQAKSYLSCMFASRSLTYRKPLRSAKRRQRTVRVCLSKIPRIRIGGHRVPLLQRQSQHRTKAAPPMRRSLPDEMGMRVEGSFAYISLSPSFEAFVSVHQEAPKRGRRAIRRNHTRERSVRLTYHRSVWRWQPF